MVTFVDGPVRILVPATSANLGPGFDSLGLALTLHDTLQGQVLETGLEVMVEGEGADTVPRDERHLVVRSMNAAFDALGARPSGLRLQCTNVIPHARGLGSSSAAIVGGLALARALVEGGTDQLDDLALFQMAADIEGHPDNVAPACFGGFVVAGDDDGFFAVQAPIDPEIGAVVFVPPHGVETEVARGLLPAEVPHRDAAANSGRAALLVAALGARPDQLLRATRDLLHQNYRRPAMPQSLDLVEALRADGIAAVVSGAGPTVLAFTYPGGHDVEELLARCPRGWVAQTLTVDVRGVRSG
ncbi:MAG: homoserine kinase [Nocardioides sp.]